VPYTYRYPHPAVTVDILVFTLFDGQLSLLLVQRGQEPFKGQWALPGGFVEIDESLKRAAWRELKEETGVHAATLRQLGAFGQPDRDPRERIITVAYYALVPSHKLSIRAASDAADARVFAVNDLPGVAGDHGKIIARGIERLRREHGAESLAMQLLPNVFTLPQLQHACESILATTLDKRNFQKKVRLSGLVEATGEQHRVGAHRPAKLFRASATVNPVKG
jgi:8-oxo-dGTP diphosphatase